MDEDRLLFELADRLHNRFYGKYRGIVTAVDQATLRIKATVPAVLGTTPTGWCLPCVPYAGPGAGFFFIPDAGAAVWIEFEGGDVSYPIWSGCFWRAGELPADAAPATRGLVTAAPHKLLFDDAADEVTLADASNGTVVLDRTGVTSARGGKKVVVADGSVDINDGALEVT
jgi:uncharacterized protein involved in type VI secretion and phage assembly